MGWPMRIIRVTWIKKKNSSIPSDSNINVPLSSSLQGLMSVMNVSAWLIVLQCEYDMNMIGIKLNI